jgi:hypothetical protein
MTLVRLAAFIGALLLAGCGAAPALPGPGGISFALIGDVPYSEREIPILDRLVDEMNGQDLAFVVHVGDITSGRGPCSDEWYEARKRQFARLRHPLVLLPGDNEWTDCHRSGRDPMERLAKLRQLFFSGDESLGMRTMKLERQSADPRAVAQFGAYPEHARWVAADVLFVALNVPGSNNNLGRTREMDREHTQRMGAVLAWLASGTRLVMQKQLAGMVVLMHADPDFGGAYRREGVNDGFAGLRAALAQHALTLRRPILLAHGDEHVYRHDQPLSDPATGRRIDHFTRVEVFGSPLAGWVKGVIDPSDPQLFRVGPAGAPVPF